ncbi:hypothetical protein VOLCADRAFT_121611 [Volvox carteri f. nagariensis]|uniref:Uncharacterized protein n=1 Tax=Volvox carteri f. nagariensis TaxID=3068 RepID=D8UEU1_VOLCA|nr:uncharacterized protein VOLCADRAFT_121611 [Volvox carteri f. nagariensis]EFJ41743.1 hypothetical protein VOLCADRAFT_121611 [Volvox carteri f. nagariensis]|eukprot:XP_002957245.1 hypothetical protein VOLCADRAFT_121611 [Volvox carteri f. nagariensis]
MGEIVPFSKQGEDNSQAITLLGSAPVSQADYAERIKTAQDLEAKLKHIQETMPTKVYNVSSSSAGAGSGDFHQYRIVRRAEQDRVRKMEADWEKKQQEAEFKLKIEELNKIAEDRTAKKRLKRQKKKEQKKQKKGLVGEAAAGGDGQDSGQSGSEDNGQPALD